MDKLDKSVELEQVQDIRILLVDDEPHMLDSLSSLMRHYGYCVDTALGGRAAIDKLSHQHFDLLLVDLRMPGVNGHQVMEFVLEEKLPTLTVVVSGETTYDEMSRALRNGAYDYLKKPYAPEELIATVNNTIRKSRLEKEHQAMRQKQAESEQLHRYIVNNSPDIIFMLDERGCFQFLNDKIVSLLGYQRDELLGSSWLDLVEPVDCERAQFFFQNLDLGTDFAHNIELSLLPARPSRSRNYFELSLWSLAESNAAMGEQAGLYKVYGTARDITERKEAEAFINFQAYHDLLTRLPNRALFKDRLSLAMAQARRSKQCLAVMFLDLDRFKIVNDSLGHTIGDRLLQAVSVRLSECLRKGDTLSRFGGDEFTLLLPEVASEAAAATIAEKIIKALKEPFFLDDHEIYVGCSIGIVTFPEGGDDIETLIQNADAAMYHIKQRGKDGYAFYRDEMTINSTKRLYVERDIRRALENNEFEVHYQAQVSIQSGDLLGLEALIRWQHPEKGFVYPQDFIPIAEETRLIVEIDRWMLRRACEEVSNWFCDNQRGLRLGVNFSPQFVEQSDFVDSVLQVLAETGVAPGCLELEITENAILSDMDHTIDKLKRLSQAGISIAIDDFGTGYSSLSYLHKFPVDTLKIDRSFIHNINISEDEACIVDAVVSMAQGLKLHIIAEGVETTAQLDYLKELGCHAVQGYLLGQAQPAEVVAKKYWLGKMGPLGGLDLSSQG